MTGLQTYLQPYVNYWRQENHDRPLLALYSPKPGAPAGSSRAYANQRERWLDFPGAIARARAAREATVYSGDAFPYFDPNLGPDILGAILGADLEFTDTTSWSKTIVSSCSEIEQLAFNKENFWWTQIEAFTRMAVEDANGAYFVGITDLHPSMDALVSLVGPETLCYDIVDDPEHVENLVWQVHEVFRAVYGQLKELTATHQHGVTSNWMNVLYPWGGYVTSCDFICLISQAHFRRFVLPELEAELDFLPNSLFHLDGPGALKHLDDLLALPKLGGIQWVPGDGAAPAREWTELLQKIQDSGKLIQMTITPCDLAPLLDALRPEGVMFSCACQSEQEARELLAMAQRRYGNVIGSRWFPS